MKSRTNLKPTHSLYILLLFIGIFVRIWQLGAVPGGINQDEAFAGYEAYSLLHYGKDSFGYSFPVYFVSWGSGMNVLNSYLMLPFIALFGAHTWVIRLPQVITACFSLWVFYLLLKKLFDEQIALSGLFFLVICPWHIMLSRWGLESNLVPGFLLFGLYFFILGIEKSKYFILSALFYGLSLYCYATIWPIVPLMLILQTVYLLYTNKLKADLNLLWAILLLVLLALPLLLFLLINTGYMEEIKTSFLSIPKLPVMRNNEVSFENIPGNFQNLWNVITNQNDGLYWNSTDEYGLYYKGTLLFAVLGFCYCIKNTFLSLMKREFNYQAFAIIPFLCAAFLGCLIHVNVNRINCIHLWIVLFIAVGMCYSLKLLKVDFSHIPIMVCAAFTICFVSFEIFYFNTYQEKISSIFQAGLEQSVGKAEALANDNELIYVSSDFKYSKILFFSKIPVTEYISTVQYTNYPAPYMNISSCGKYCFDYQNISTDHIYIIPASLAAEYQEMGFTVDICQKTAVAYYP